MFVRSKIQEMMLRRRSRSMSSSKQNHLSHLPSDTTIIRNSDRNKQPATCASSSLFFTSPRLLHSSSLPNSVTEYPILDSEVMAYSMSPTSVLESTRAFSSDSGSQRRPWCVGVGLLGLADALGSAQGNEKTSVLASQLKVQIPLIRSNSVDCSPVEFGVKDKSSWVPLNDNALSPPPGEMELSSEDYTCVISRGPNPRTRHIFGDRIVESCGDGFIAVRDKESSRSPSQLPRCDPNGFLSL